MDVFQKMASHYAEKLPFAVYSKPGSADVTGVFQHDGTQHELTDFTENGFAFVSFDGEDKLYIPANKADVYVEKAADKVYPYPQPGEPKQDAEVKKNFEALVEKGVKAIHNGAFKKVVLSRIDTQKPAGLNPVEITKQLQLCYPSAFTYCFFHPRTGLWFGATPEQLLQVEDLKIKTVALAGTQLHAVGIGWEAKEKDEQQLVTDFILESLKKHCTDISVSAPYTAKAGNLAHIKTDISALLNDKGQLGKLIELLHPTPAVCGLPKEAAKQFILENEGYDRKFYTGFLGELNIDFRTLKTATSDLFVNLRCMEATAEAATIYVGCGITKDSNPAKEYIETQNKTMTMRKVINLQN